jgi:hypothetical protein
LRAAWRIELLGARRARREGERGIEWRHLERAHVLSQPMAVRHVRSHVAMLSFGVRSRDLAEIRGQLVRLIVAGPGSLLGRYPLGNTGGARVPARAVMPIPDDLAQHLAT